MSHQWYILRSNWNYRMKIALGALGEGPGFWLKSWVKVPGTQPRAGWAGKGPVGLSKRCWVSLHWGLGRVAWVTLDQGSSKMTSCCAVSVSGAVLRAQECHLCRVSTDGWAQAPQQDVSPVEAALGLAPLCTNTSDWTKGGPRATESKSTALSFYRRGNLEQRRKALSTQSLNGQTHLGKFTIV